MFDDFFHVDRSRGLGMMPPLSHAQPSDHIACNMASKLYKDLPPVKLSEPLDKPNFTNMSVLSSKYLKPHDVSSRCTYYKRSLHWHGHVGSAMYLIGSESLTPASSEQKMATKDPIMQFGAFLEHNNMPSKPNFQSSCTSCVANAAAATTRLRLHPAIKLESRTTRRFKRGRALGTPT